MIGGLRRLAEELQAQLHATRMKCMRTENRLAIVTGRSSCVQEELQAQLGAMQRELGGLEAELACRDVEAADLSRCLADLRAKLGNPDAAPASNSVAYAGPVPGALLARLGARPPIPAVAVMTQHWRRCCEHSA